MTRAEIEQLLPAVFQRAIHERGPLAAILDVMEALHGPSEAIIADLDATLDFYRAADAFVPFLASWLDLERIFDDPTETRPLSERPPISTGLGRLREIMAAAPQLSQWRGTSKGLLLFLHVATGASGFDIDEDVRDAGGRPRPFHIRVRAPESVRPHQALVERIIAEEKPAYVTYELVIGGP